MICLMHEASPYGHLIVHGQPPNEAQLASLTGIPAAELPHLVAELERLGVFSRTKEGVIYSRKLVRMVAKSAKARKSGKLGGNPSLRKGGGKTASVKGSLKGDDKPHKPETIIQKEKRTSSSPPAAGPPKAATADPPGFAALWDAYPHRGGARQGRKPAVAAYAKALKAVATPEAILAGALRFATSRKALDGYAPDVATWLNRGGWEDEPEPPRATPPTVNGAPPDHDLDAIMAQARAGLRAKGILQ